MISGSSQAASRSRRLRRFRTMTEGIPETHRDLMEATKGGDDEDVVEAEVDEIKRGLIESIGYALNRRIRQNCLNFGRRPEPFFPVSICDPFKFSRPHQGGADELNVSGHGLSLRGSRPRADVP